MPEDPTSPRTTTSTLVAVVAAAAVAVGVAATPALTRWRTHPHRSAPAGVAALTVRAEDPAGGYSRAAFGPRWKDTDGNGCGQRDDALARDLTDPVRQGRCVVVGGVLADPYTGTVIGFAKATAADVQIDHIVPLREAWRSGAATWTPDRRTALATDLGNLQTTLASVNESKGDRDPARWRPPNPAYRCTYARRYTAVKVKYTLAVDPAERAALAALLATCGPELVAAAYGTGSPGGPHERPRP